MPCAEFLHALFTSRYGVSRSSNSLSSRDDALLLSSSTHNTTPSTYQLTSNQHVATSIQSLILHAIERNEVQTLTDLCAEFTLPYILSQTDFQGETLLMHASRLFKDDVIVFLLEMGSNIFEEDSRNRMTMMHVASGLAHGVAVLEIVREFLLEEYNDDDGRDMIRRMVNVASSHDGRVPLHFAIEHDRWDVFLWLLQMGANVEGIGISSTEKTTTTSKSRTKPTNKMNAPLPIPPPPLLYCAKHARLRMLKHLQQHGANVESTDHLGNTALLIATEQGFLDIVRYLLEEAHANLHAKASYNLFTALHYAASENHYHLCKYLVEAGLNVDERDTILRTPLHTACIAGHAQTAYVLVRYCGADPQLEDDTETYESSMDESTPLKNTPGGKTALDLAYECGVNAMRVAEALQKAQRELNALRGENISANPGSPRGRTSSQVGYVSSPLAKSTSRDFDEHSPLSILTTRSALSTHSYGSTTTK